MEWTSLMKLLSRFLKFFNYFWYCNPLYQRNKLVSTFVLTKTGIICQPTVAGLIFKSCNTFTQIFLQINSLVWIITGFFSSMIYGIVLADTGWQIETIKSTQKFIKLLTLMTESPWVPSNGENLLKSGIEVEKGPRQASSSKLKSLLAWKDFV